MTCCGYERPSLSVQTTTLCAGSELQSVKASIIKKQQIYDTQEFSLVDIHRVKMERQELTRQTEVAEQEGQTLDKHIWQGEMAISKLHDKVCVVWNGAPSFTGFFQRL